MADNVQLSSAVRDRLESSKESVAILIRTVQAGRPEGMSGGHPNTRLTETVQVLKDACTKLALLFTRPPPPSVQECGCMCARLDQTTLSFVSAYGLVNDDHGAVYGDEVKAAVLTVLCDLDKLLDTIMKQGCTRSASQLHKTGTVWTSCDNVARLSTDNLAASLKLYLSQLHLLRDALSEVNTLEANNGASEGAGFWDDEVTEVTDTLRGVSLEEVGGAEWTDEERGVIIPSLQLIKLSVEVTECASRLLVSGGHVNQEGGVAQMDCGCGLVQQLSPAVDDLTNEMEAPVAIDTCRSFAVTLGKALLKFVQTLSSHHYCPSDKWSGERYTKTVEDCIGQLTT